MLLFDGTAQSGEGHSLLSVICQEMFHEDLPVDRVKSMTDR